MVEKENINNIQSTGSNNEEDLDALLLSFNETCGEGQPSPEKLAEMARKAPEACACGNEHVEIVSHNLILRNGKSGMGKGASVEVKNIAGAAIGMLALKTLLFDAKGYTIDTIEKTITDFEPGITRVVHFNTSAQKADVKSYEINITSMVLTPVPVATGDNRLSILKHNIHESMNADTDEIKKELEIAVKNISAETIAIAVINAEIFDAGGNSLGEVRQIETDIKPGTSRAILIQIDSILKFDSARSYKIDIAKTITSDTQKVLLRRDERKALPNGDINISGVIKNVSGAKTDAAVSVTFLDAKKEELGVVVSAVNDIQPGTTKPFSLVFRPPARDMVKTYTVDIGEAVEAAC